MHEGVLLIPSCSAVLIKANILFENSNDLLKVVMNYYQGKIIPVVQRSNFNESINAII